MKKDLTISFDELMSELDSFRNKATSNRILTKEQKLFLEKCRENSNPVSYVNMSKLWTKAGWGIMNKSTIREIWLKLNTKD